MNEKKLKIELKQIIEKIKPNPNNFIIIEKWNYKKIFLPNRNKIFLLISEYIDNNIPTIIEEMINNFANVNDLIFEEET